MIIELLMNLIYIVFNSLTLVLQIPGMPDKVGEFLGIALDYIITGIAICGNFLDMNYLLVLFSIISIGDMTILIYKIIMWVLKKIPILNIK